MSHTCPQGAQSALGHNGQSYISGELADWIEVNEMGHVRDALYHPQTQSKIERWHQIFKSQIFRQHYIFPGDLEQQIELFEITTIISDTMKA